MDTQDYQFQVNGQRDLTQKSNQDFFRPKDVVDVVGCTYLEACKIIASLQDLGVVHYVDLSSKQIYGYTYRFKQM